VVGGGVVSVEVVEHHGSADDRQQSEVGVGLQLAEGGRQRAAAVVRGHQVARRAGLMLRLLMLPTTHRQTQNRQGSPRDDVPLDDSKFVGGITLRRRSGHQYTHTHTHLFNGPFSGTTQVSRYQKGRTNLDFTEARDSEWQWHQLGQMQVCTSLQTGNHASASPLSCLQAGCPFCRPTNSVKALKASVHTWTLKSRRIYVEIRARLMLRR